MPKPVAYLLRVMILLIRTIPSLVWALMWIRATGPGGYEVYTRCPILREQPNEIVEMIIDDIDRHRDITVDKTRYLTVLY